MSSESIMKSLWSETARLPQFPSQNGDIKTDVLIIGGGIAGILTAYFLQQNGIDYVLVEKGTGNARRKSHTRFLGCVTLPPASEFVPKERSTKNLFGDNTKHYRKNNRSAWSGISKNCKKLWN